MEVRIEVQAKDPLGVNKWDPLILATFTMVHYIHHYRPSY